MNTKKITVYLAACTAVAMMMISLYINIVHAKPAADIQAAPEELYMLKYESGCVHLYEGKEIIETFGDVNYMNLPYEDRKKLSEGIVIETAEDAFQLIEDFDG